jgi:DNA-binding response OmpR family regulator
MALPEVPENGRFRILVVEDDTNIARLILLNLAKANMECMHAPDGLAGLARFKESEPHLVITDIMMPNMNGMELCAKIREISSVPILMMTAADTEEHEMQGFKSGADDYVPKPFNPKLLVARVLANLRRVYRYDVTALAAVNTASNAAAPAAPPASPATPEAPDPLSSRSDWVTCEACGYMGPRAKFQKTDSTGKVTMTCPVCKQNTISFSIT